MPRLPGLVLLLVAAGACEVPHAPAPVLQVESQAVTGGAPEPGSPAVGAIVPVSPTCGEETSPVICTGTLVAPRVVLTAAHCVENTEAPQLLSVVFAAEAGLAPASQRVRAVAGRLHPDWRSGENDIGALILAEDAPVAPVPLAGAALPGDAVGRMVRVVGFGADDAGHTGSRRSGTARVTGVERETFSIAAAPGMSCGGDSGGPVFLEADGAERLVGVTSFGDLACTSGVNTRVDVHAAFVQAILDEAAQAPSPRPPLDLSVDACEAPCEEHADCPLGLACVARPGGGKSCAVAGLEAGRFGAACDGPEGARPCVKAGEACRLWLPCEVPARCGPWLPCGEEGGCTASGGGALAALAGLLVGVLRRRGSRL